MTRHVAEAFDGSFGIGWECLDCSEGRLGFQHIADAESAADAHEDDTA